MNAERKTEELDLLVRTKQHAIRVLHLVRALPHTIEGRAVANQIIRSGTSIGANHRAARRARSRAEFIAKLGIVVEEADETVFWLEVIIESGMLDAKLIQPLLAETRQLLAIMVASSKTASVKRA